MNDIVICPNAIDCDDIECLHYKPHEKDFDGFTRVSGDYWSSCKNGVCGDKIIKCNGHADMPDFIDEEEMEI